MASVADEIKTAWLSYCGTYRYSLERIWNPCEPTVMFIGLNPSTADAVYDDPTIRRCRGFAKAWGFGGFVMANLFAYRSTYPKELYRVDCVGPENNAALVRLAGESQRIVAAWGSEQIASGRARAVSRILMNFDMQCLGRTKAGAPRHPLYVKGDKQLEPFHVSP